MSVKVDSPEVLVIRAVLNCDSNSEARIEILENFPKVPFNPREITIEEMNE